MTEKFTLEHKLQIVIELFTAAKIAELYNGYSISSAQFCIWSEKLLDSERKKLSESSIGNQYQKEIDDFKSLVGI